MKAKLLIMLMAGLFVASNYVAQDVVTDANQPCSLFHMGDCGFKEELINFEYNSQSRSGLCKRGETSSLYVVCYKGMDYRFAFCAKADLLEGKDMQIKIYEKRTKKLIYDSASQNYETEFEFTCTNSISLLIEVILPKTAPVPDNKFEFKGCVGTLMHSRKSLKTGF